MFVFMALEFFLVFCVGVGIGFGSAGGGGFAVGVCFY